MLRAVAPYRSTSLVAFRSCSGAGYVSTKALISIDSRGGVVGPAVGSGKEQCAPSGSCQHNPIVKMLSRLEDLHFATPS